MNDLKINHFSKFFNPVLIENFTALAANSFMKIHYQKIEKRKPVVWDNWQTHEVHYFSLRAATADVRASRAKMMPHPTHANTFSGLSANSAKRGVGMAMPPKNGLMNLCIAISFRVGMCCYQATMTHLLFHVQA